MKRDLPLTCALAGMLGPAVMFTLAVTLALTLTLTLSTTTRAWSATTADAPATLAALQAQADQHRQAGYDRPVEALAALDALSASTTSAASAQGAKPLPVPQVQRVLALTRGLLAAEAGPAHAAQARLALAELQRLPDDALAAADAQLLQASLAQRQSRVGEAAQLARAAADGYEQACPQTPGCDHRSPWQALYWLALLDDSRGMRSAALESALTAAEVAREAGDPMRQAWALALAARLHGALGDDNAEQQHLAQARHLAQTLDDARLWARLRVFEAQVQSRRDDIDAAVRTIEAGLMDARRADSPRLAALLQTNLSDLHLRGKRPQSALQSAAAARPVTQRFGDLRGERTLMHNAALAHIALGQQSLARPVLDELLAAHRQSGASANEVQALKEFSIAYGDVGDWKSALALYHLERELRAELMAADRDAVLARLRASHDSDAEHAQMEQLARESALLDAQLRNRDASQRLWLGGGAALVLALALVALLYRRVRQINRRLALSQAELRTQSQRDALTGLVNRRGLHEAVATQGDDGQCRGALMLVDIDHFKQVNDQHGHAAGDAVLVEVARRLNAVVREQDMVVRWGGEEFLIHMRQASPDAARALADRVLRALAGEPVPLPASAMSGDVVATAATARSLRISASLGYGCFPLPTQALPLSVERAINLADMALYTAKNQGRNRAIGIASVNASSDAELLSIEAAFEPACRDGRVHLECQLGPSAAASNAQPPAATAAHDHEDSAAVA